MKTSEKIKQLAKSLKPLDLVEAAMEELADLVFESGNEELVWIWGIANSALTDAQVESRMAQEDRRGPHQYYYPEDMDSETPVAKTTPMDQPLEVDQPDVTMRGTP